MKKTLKWTNTIKARQLTLLFAILFFVISCSYLFFRGAAKVATDAIYEKMEAQAEYYLESIDSEIEGIMRMQVEFFSDRQLFFLAGGMTLLSPYEWREALLSTQDRIFSFLSTSSLVEDVILYIPSSDYILTAYNAKRFTKRDWETLERIKKNAGQLELTDGVLSFSLAESISKSKEPNFILQIIFNQDQIVRNLNSFITEQSGSFWANKEINLFLEDTGGLQEGNKILSVLSEGDFSMDGGIAELKTDRDEYLISAFPSQYLGWLVQYYPQKQVMSQMNGYAKAFFVFVFVAIGMMLLFSQFTEKLVNRPLRKLYQAFDVLKEGNTDIKINHSGNDEFAYIYDGFNHMTGELHRLIDEVYVQKDLAQRAELKQLQTQINPHFLYNSFFILSRRVKKGDMEGAELFSNYLGTYFQFLTRNTSDTVSLLKEIEHAECYARIQEARFRTRIKVELEELPKEREEMLVPRLIVQPLLENAFCHGLEDKEEDGLLKVFYTVLPFGIRIHIENNGDITEEQIDKMRRKCRPEYQGEITGLINIHRRLVGYYKGKAGLEISRGENGGICVSIVIEGDESLIL